MISDNSAYNPETYWTKVAKEINGRELKNYVAGDDEPFYRYKRTKFLALLKEIDFKNKSVLEVGCGPGGNLEEIIIKKPSNLDGVDISEEMVKLARKNLKDLPVTICRIDGLKLPFDTNSKDIVLTATVLQHNTNREMLKNLVSEICRVSAGKVILFERIEKKLKAIESCEGRPVSFYIELLSQNGFELLEVKYLPISFSYYACGIIRKIFNRKKRKEGEQLTAFSVFLQRLVLPITKILDRLFIEKRDVARMIFVKKIN